MLNKKRDHGARSQSAEEPQSSIGAMAFADKVAAEYQALETGYRNGRYKFIGLALTSYRKFLKDTVDYKELLGRDNIAGLREKPDLKTTSRLVLYHLTGARNVPERNTAGKYARIVDYLHQERVDNAAAADHVRSVGGIDEILKKARGREALKAADQTLRDDVQDFDQKDEPDEAGSLALISSDITDGIFDPDQDLSIRVKDEVHAQVLGPDVPMGEPFYLKCKKMGSACRDGVRIVGILVNPPSE